MTRRAINGYDEFLRIRMIMDQEYDEIAALEQRLINMDGVEKKPVDAFVEDEAVYYPDTWD